MRNQKESLKNGFVCTVHCPPLMLVNFLLYIDENCAPLHLDYIIQLIWDFTQDTKKCRPKKIEWGDVPNKEHEKGKDYTGK